MAQVRLRGERLGIRDGRLLVLAETDVSRIVAEAEARKASLALAVVDSIQAVADPTLASSPGTVSQGRARLGSYAVRQDGGSQFSSWGT